MINVKTDWKIITLWIGGNDLCKYCYTDKSKGGTTAQEYHDAIKESLDYLKANVKPLGHLLAIRALYYSI